MLIIECPDGKLYPVSSIILYSVGLGLCNTLFNNWFNIVIIAKFENIDNPIFLFFIETTIKVPYKTNYEKSIEK